LSLLVRGSVLVVLYSDLVVERGAWSVESVEAQSRALLRIDEKADSN
jgi:hypothetical protein